jgi:radical SAM protein with 4Fe4S-binding SPASM domain
MFGMSPPPPPVIYKIILDFEKDTSLSIINQTITIATADISYPDDYRLVLCFNENHSLEDISYFSASGYDNTKIMFLDLFDFTINEDLINLVSTFAIDSIPVNITVMVNHSNLSSILTSLQPYQSSLTDTHSLTVLTLYYYIQNNYDYNDIITDLTSILDFGTLFNGIGIDNSYCFLYDLYSGTNKSNILTLYTNIASWYKNIITEYSPQKINTLHYYINQEVHLLMGWPVQCLVPRCGVYNQALNTRRINVASNGDFYPCSYLRGNPTYKIGDSSSGLNQSTIDTLQASIELSSGFTKCNNPCSINEVCLPKCPFTSVLGFDNTFCEMQQTIVDGITSSGSG